MKLFIFFEIKINLVKKTKNIEITKGKKTIIIEIEKDKIRDNKNIFLLLGFSIVLIEKINNRRVIGN